jgi:hypothetical protein
LYSYSFNPIFNSINKKNLTFPGLFSNEKGTAQIKILKNNSSNDPLSPTDQTVSEAEHSTTLLRHLTTRATKLAQKKKVNLKRVVNSKGNVFTINRSLSKFGTKVVKKSYKPSLTKLAKVKAAKAKKKKGYDYTAKSKNNSTAMGLPPIHTNYEASEGAQVVGAVGPVGNVGTVGAQAHLRLSFILRAEQRMADNNRFLFLYFIVPIFFEILKTSTAAVPLSAIRSNTAGEVGLHNTPSGENGEKAKSHDLLNKKVVMHAQKKLNNQIKQLRSLLKLMLVSGPALRKRISRQPNTANFKTKISTTSPNKSKGSKIYAVSAPKGWHDKGKNNLNTTLLLNRTPLVKDINKLIVSLKLNIFKDIKTSAGRVASSRYKNKDSNVEAPLSHPLLAEQASLISKKGSTSEQLCSASQKLEQVKIQPVLTQTKLANLVKNIAIASDLLKWTVLFIAQSLAPLKRKHDYYSFIFIKILKSRRL